MNRVALLSILLATAACGPSPANEPAPATPAPPPPATSEPPPATTAAPAPSGTATSSKSPDPGLSSDAAALEKARAQMAADSEKEKARWTPELRAEAKALAEKTYPSGRAAIEAAVKGKHRRPGHADRDKHRHPVETLDFWGFKPTMTVLEYLPGEGWFTELLAPALAKKGKLLVTSGDPNGPATDMYTLYAQNYKAFLERAPEVYGKVETVTVDSKAPKLGREGTVDMIVVARGLHGMVNSGTIDEWLREFHSALKPNAVLGIEQHRAAPDAKPEESAKKGYLPEKWVIEKIEKAGFKLAGKSEINANPKDTKDYPEGVWTLPPTLKNGDKDREKYLAIGESDRMTLKFTKVAQKPDAAKKDEPKKDESKKDQPKKDEPKK